MTPIMPPTRTNPEIAIKEMELKVLEKFLSSDRQKTQITPEERVLISVIDGMANNPYPISQSICKKLGINFNPLEFKIDFMIKFLEEFIQYGIPLNREGRKEEVKVLGSYFEAQRQDDNNDKTQTVTSKLMK